METTLLGPEYYWECIPEDAAHYARYSLYKKGSDLYLAYVIDREIDVHVYMKRNDQVFQSVAEAKRWCEMMILTGA